jgi:RNA polymerase sigma factor (sigma-70 family)
MSIIKLILLFNIIYIVKSFYLTYYQLNLINNLIRNGNISVYQRNKINNILFKAFENFSIKKAIEFKNKHKFKCRDIKNDELFLSSKIGLFKAIKKYNGYNLANYSIIYINSELFRLITDKYSLCPLPKSYRMKSKANLSTDELRKYKKLLNTKMGSFYDNWQLDTLFTSDENVAERIMNNNEFQEKISNLIDKLSPSLKKIFYLKYFSDNKIVSNKKISEIMSCSEENIRKKVCLIKKIAIKSI